MDMARWAAPLFGGFSQHMAQPAVRLVPLEAGHSPNHLKNMKLQILARDVLMVAHPGRVRPQRRQELEMTQTFPRNPFTREDTILGVCESLGEDFRFPPLLLRVAFGVGLFLNPFATIGAYLGLGALVLVSRLISPNPRRPRPPVPAFEESEAAPQPLHADNETELLPVAA
jgi:phage shock protein C